MAISGVTSGVASGSIRDKWNNADLLGEDGEKTEGTGSTDKTQVWNAVFEEKKTGVTADDFLTLMVAQLTNQDFMNPVDDTQYVTQLAQFTTMQQMQEMANYTKTSYVMSLVGKNVTAAKITVSGELQKEVGPVQKITLTNNEFGIWVNDKKFSLEQIMEINQDGAASSSGGTDTDTGTGAADESQKNYLLSLIGKHVTVTHKISTSDDEESGASAVVEISGVVEKTSTKDGSYRVWVDGGWYSLDEVTEVGEKPVEPDQPTNQGESGETEEVTDNG